MKSVTKLNGSHPLIISQIEESSKWTIPGIALLFGLLGFFLSNFASRSGNLPAAYSYYSGITINHTKVERMANVNSKGKPPRTNGLGGGAYKQAQGDTSDCTGLSGLSSPSPNRWEGTKSTDWFDTENWTMGFIPGSDDTALIPCNTPYSPVVKNGQQAECETFILKSDNQILLEEEARLSVRGDLHINGGFEGLYRSKLIIAGNAAQTLNASERIQVYNLEINNSSGTGVTFNAPVWVENRLDFKTGMIYNGNDTIKILNDSEQAVVGHQKDRYVAGLLTRKINIGYTDYVFPVGKGDQSSYNWAIIETKALEGTQYITAHFKDVFNHSDADLQLNDQGLTIESLNKAGIWLIEPDVQPTGGAYDIKLSIENMTQLVDNSFCIIKRPTGADATQWDLGSGTLNSSDGLGRRTSDGFALLKDLTSFSEFGVGDEAEGDALPIELGYFNAKPWNENSVMLTWETYTEINNDYFTVEHSTDGENFTTIGKVQGAGNSVGVSQYEMLHENPAQGENYYRLKQTDFDGESEYFDIKNIYIKANVGIDDIYVDRVGPNPFSSRLVLRYHTTDVRKMTVKMYNLSGAIVLFEEQTLQPGINSLAINGLSELSQGTYVLEISDNEKYKKAVKIIKSL